MSQDATPTAADEAPKAETREASPPALSEVTTQGPPKDPVVGGDPEAPPGGPATLVYRPNYVFLGVLAVITLVLDLGSKAWAKGRLEDAKAFADRHIELVSNHLAFTFAKNRGGAWGLFQEEPESVRRPLFLAISALAIGFIVSLYRKLTPRQWALKWGLPLVLGGALGNLVNRIQYNYVVDFIDYRADWMRSFNGLFSSNGAAGASDHWPTFNIADIAIVAGVVLMAVDMFTPTPKTELIAKVGVAPGPPREPASPTAIDPEPVIAPPVPVDEAPKPHAPAET